MITSKNNSLIKRIRRLSQKKHRRREGAFFIEGVRVVLSAVEAKAPIQTIVYAPGFLKSDAALKMVADQRESGTECIETSTEVFQSISSREGPVGLGAVVSISWTELDNLSRSPDGLFVALWSVSEPGNLGAIIRSIDGAAGDGVILVGSGVDPHHPSAVKASMGSLFHVPLCQINDGEPLFSWAQMRGIQSIATSAHAEEPFSNPGYRKPVMLLFGNEGEGLPEEIMARADRLVSIPMRGSASSLNLAVAAGIMLFEVVRQT